MIGGLTSRSSAMYVLALPWNSCRHTTYQQPFDARRSIRYNDLEQHRYDYSIVTVIIVITRYTKLLTYLLIISINQQQHSSFKAYTWQLPASLKAKFLVVDK